MNIVDYITHHYADVSRLLWQHFYLFLISTFFAIIIGMLVSILVTRESIRGVRKIVLSVTGAAQAVPSIAVVALVFLFVGIGSLPAIIALVIYSIVPIIFNGVSGIISVDPNIVEASKGIGFTKVQILWKIEIPLAVPVIMAGIRSAATINIGTATVASVIGGGGLGDLIFMGLKLNRNHLIFIGAGLSAFLAIVIDTLLYFCEQKVTPRGLTVVR